MSANKLRIGISSCLLGEEVRFDGGHKRDRFVTNLLSQYADYVRVCPEVEIGMGIPREPVHLVLDGDRTRLVTVRTGRDYTDAMETYSRSRSKALAAEQLDGYILKSKSPSCGMERVKVYRGDMATRDGRGKFAEALMDTMPHLPVEEEGRLNDARLRENFVSRCYAYRRWQEMTANGLARKNLIRFHECHKYALMAHNQAGVKRLGRIVANPKSYSSTSAMAGAYLTEFTAVMQRTPTRRNHVNALQHMAGYLRKLISDDDRRELSDLIMVYHDGEVPLIAPLTLLRHFARKYEPEYLLTQVYLHPHPAELMLLNQL